MKSHPSCILLALPLLMAADAVPPSHNLDSTLATLIEKNHLPGAVGAIIHGDHVVALGSAGVRKLGNLQPFLNDDVVHLGSDTKAMTAVLIGQLIDQKKLSFDTPMREIFPKLAGKMNSEMAAVTVRDLLTHTAGLPHDLAWGAIDATGGPLIQQRRSAVQLALTAAPVTSIGKFSYSNVGYVLLGAIIEEKTGQPWEEVIQKQIFDPLEMKSAVFGFPGSLGKVDQPWGHALENGTLTPVQVDNKMVMAPAGCVHCSMEDWCKFVSQVLSMSRGHSALLSAETFKQLISPKPEQDYTGGWLVTQRPWAGGTALTHSGSNTTWFCTVWIAPAKDFAVLIAINDGATPAAQAADNGIGALIKFNNTLMLKK